MKKVQVKFTKDFGIAKEGQEVFTSLKDAKAMEKEGIVVIIDNPNKREKEAKYARDKHVLEQIPKVMNDDPTSKNTAVIIAGVDPENYDKIKKEQRGGEECGRSPRRNTWSLSPNPDKSKAVYNNG